jgi:hypothetical protein
VSKTGKRVFCLRGLIRRIQAAARGKSISVDRKKAVGAKKSRVDLNEALTQTRFSCILSCEVLVRLKVPMSINKAIVKMENIIYRDNSQLSLF